MQHTANLSEESPASPTIHSEELSGPDNGGQNGDQGAQLSEQTGTALNTSTAATSDNLHTTNPALFTNILVYALADKFDIGTLKNVAAWKFARRIGEAWYVEDLPELVRGIYESTPETDRVLRDIISDKAAKNVREVLKDSKCVALMKENAEFTFDLLLRVHGDGSREIATLRAEAKDRDAALEEGKRALGIKAVELSSKDQEIERLDALISSVERATKAFDKCRNCADKFGAYVETSYDSVTVRCKSCRCRHEWTGRR